MNTVAQTFDPYHKWLGIAPKDQPANHYRLLGIDLFESDPDTISNAADQRMAHVRSFQTGQNSKVSQQILNEIAAARVCLLDPAKKFAYDAGLKEEPRPVVTPVVNQRPVSKMNTQMALLILGAAAVGVLAVVLLWSRSKPTVARPPVAEKPAQTREAPPPKPSNEEEPEPKPKPEQKPQSPPEPEPKPETDVKPKDKTEDATNEDSQRKSEGPDSTNPAPDSTAGAANTGKSAGYLDLLSRVDLDRDVVSGKWTREGGGLTASPRSRVRLPVKVNGGYDLLVTFTRSNGGGDVALLLPVGSHQCGMFFSAWNGQIHGLDIIDGQRGVSNPINTRPGPLTNGRQYTALLKVRLMKEKNASIEVLLDNSLVVRWQGKESALTLWEAYTVRPSQIGLGTGESAVTFHSATFRLVSGNASWIGGREIVAQAASAESVEGELPVKRLIPIPDQVSQDKACSQVKELFDADHTAAKGSSEKLSALASKLLEKAQETTDEASQYVLLDFAKTFSVEAGNAALAMRAIDQIGDRFQCDVLVLKVECIADCAKAARTSEQTTTLLTTIEPIIQASLAEADFDTAKNLSRVAVELARKIRDSATLKRLAATNREIEDLERQYYRDVKPAMEVLKRTPDDPTANLVAGKYLCLRGNWEKGLPMLALGSDSELKSLARADLKSLTDGSEQKRLADEWWNFASKHEEFRASARQRASEWYRKALPVLTGLEKEVATKRIAEAEGGNDDDGTVVKRTRFSSPESLKVFLPVSNVPVGIRNGAVVLVGNSGTLVPLVYNGYFEEIKSVRIIGGIAPPGKFSFRMAVGPVSMILNWENADENHFRCVDGGKKGVVRPRVLVPGKFHEIVVQQEGDKAVVSVDGKSLFTCVTKLQGAISIYTYKSAIAVREIVVEGKVDPNKKVTGPSHNNVF